MRRALLTALSGLMILTLLSSTVIAEAPANDAFQQTWQRTDLPVAEGVVARTWMWGPDAFTRAIEEPYTESPNGLRTVQYYDKSRMEITDPGADPSSIWYVTNGLLVVEMMTGQIQTGNNSFEPRQPAQVNVAGDANDPNGPTYATFAGLQDATPLPFDQPIIQRVDRAGNVTQDESLASQNIQIEYIDDVTGHTIAGPFWAFMNSSGTVWQDGAYIDDFLFENAFFATGRPITEPYWAEVRVAGTPRDVLMQCFERRCLTYTPGNSEGFIVEAGNTGRHYANWRYGENAIAFGRGQQDDPYSDGIHLMDEHGVNVRQLTVPPAPPDRVPPLLPGDDSRPVWSPDGQRIAYVGFRPGLSPGQSGSELAVVDSATGEMTSLANGRSFLSLDWSPDSDQLVYWQGSSFGPPQVRVISADGTGDPLTIIEYGENPDWSPIEDRILYSISTSDGYSIEAMTPTGEDTERIGMGQCPRWSPDASQIAFIQSNGPYFWVDSTEDRLMVMNADGSNPRTIVEDHQLTDCPEWSPDGTRILFEAEVDEAAIGDIFLVEGDGSGLQQLTSDGLSHAAAWSPEGERIVFAKQQLNDPNDERDDNQHIFTMAADGTNLRQITTGDVWDEEPAWNPTSTQIDRSDP